MKFLYPPTQVEAGAVAIITQPPLLWNRFEDWMHMAHRQVSGFFAS